MMPDLPWDLRNRITQEYICYEKIWICITGRIICSFVFFAVVAQQPTGKPTMTDLGKFDNWQAASFDENGKIGCFMISDATKSEAIEGTYNNRGRVYLMITHRPAANKHRYRHDVCGLPL